MSRRVRGRERLTWAVGGRPAQRRARDRERLAWAVGGWDLHAALKAWVRRRRWPFWLWSRAQPVLRNPSAASAQRLKAAFGVEAAAELREVARLHSPGLLSLSRILSGNAAATPGRLALIEMLSQGWSPGELGDVIVGLSSLAESRAESLAPIGSLAGVMPDRPQRLAEILALPPPAPRGPAWGSPWGAPWRPRSSAGALPRL